VYPVSEIENGIECKNLHWAKFKYGLISWFGNFKYKYRTQNLNFAFELQKIHFIIHYFRSMFIPHIPMVKVCTCTHVYVVILPWSTY